MTKKILHILGRKSIVVIYLFSNVLAQPTEPENISTNNYLAPAHYIIEDIRVIGTKTLDPEVLLSMIALKVGETVHIPGTAMADDIKKLWQQKLIQDVSIYASKVADNRVILTIDITEAPRLSTYIFEGVNDQDAQELQKTISLTKGAMITDWLIDSTQKVLQKYLINQGYLDAKVHITSSPDPDLPGYEQVTIHIKKSQRFIIHRIFFEGNHNIDYKILQAQMQHMHEKPRFTLVRDILSKMLTVQTWKSLSSKALSTSGMLKQLPTLEEVIAYLKYHVITSPALLVPNKYTEDKNHLIHYYQSQGYQDAAIVEETVCKSGKGLIDIRLRLEEGEPYFVRSITWLGNHIYNKDILNQRLNIHPGDVYNPALLRRKLYGDPTGNDIISLYVDNGHVFFAADPIEKIVDNAVDLVIHIQEGPKAYIDRVDIRGNTATHDQVIRRALRTLPGDTFSRAKLLRSQRELAMLNIFNPAELKVIPTPNPTNTAVDLVYVVKELPKSDVKLSGGINGHQVLIDLKLGTNNFSFLNLLQGKLPIGEAQNMSIEFRNSIDLKNFTWSLKQLLKNHGKLAIRFDDPWLGFGAATDTTMQYDKQISAWGGGLTFRRMLGWLDDYTSIRSSLNFRQYSYRDFDLLDDNTNRTGVITDTSFHASLERSSIDNPMHPTVGSELGLYVKLTPPYSLFSIQAQNSDTSNIPAYLKWAEYHQWIAQGTYFIKLFGDCVLNVQGQAGIVGRYTQSGGSPFGRFAMGGTNAANHSSSPLQRTHIPLRGYPEEYLSPQDDQHYFSGGNMFDKITLEIRYPLDKFNIVYGLIFADAGNTGLSYDALLPWAFKKSIGLGVRLHTPMGLLGFDWGYGFDKKQGNRLELHVLVGGTR